MIPEQSSRGRGVSNSPGGIMTSCLSTSIEAQSPTPEITVERPHHTARGMDKIVRLLREHGVDPSTRDK